MKKLALFLALVLGSITLTLASNSNIEESLRYYPLTTGDTCYFIQKNTLLGNELITLGTNYIGKDSLVQDGKTYKNGMFAYRERLDRNTGALYALENGKELLIDSLPVANKETFKSPFFKQMVASLGISPDLIVNGSIDNSSWLTKTRSVSRLNVPTDESNFSYELAQDIGLISYVNWGSMSYFDGTGFYRTVMSVSNKKINKYNQPYFKHNLSEYYQFKIGNSWEYENGTKIEVVKDTLVNNTTYLKLKINDKIGCVRYSPRHNAMEFLGEKPISKISYFSDYDVSSAIFTKEIIAKEERDVRKVTLAGSKFTLYKGIGIAELSDGSKIKKAFVNGVNYDFQSSIEDEGEKGSNLATVYPNPFNPSTTISLNINKPSSVEVKIFNAKGENLSTLFKGELTTGVHNLNFDGTNLNSGLYFYRIKVGDKSEVGKMILAK